MPYTVYFLRDQHGYLYIGQTCDLARRLAEHTAKSERAARFTLEHGTFELVYIEEYPTRLQAMRRESQVKRWTRAKKEALIQGDMVLLNKL